MTESQKHQNSRSVENRNYQLIFWSGALATIGGQLVNPRLVLPFLYLALGAPTFIAGLLLPFVTGARLIAEIFVSPFINRITRAKAGCLCAEHPDRLPFWRLSPCSPPTCPS